MVIGRKIAGDEMEGDGRDKFLTPDEVTLQQEHCAETPPLPSPRNIHRLPLAVPIQLLPAVHFGSEERRRRQPRGKLDLRRMETPAARRSLLQNQIRSTWSWPPRDQLVPGSSKSKSRWYVRDARHRLSIAVGKQSFIIYDANDDYQETVIFHARDGLVFEPVETTWCKRWTNIAVRKETFIIYDANYRLSENKQL